VASYYTADVNTKSFQVEFFDLKVKLMNGTTETLTEKFPDGGTVVFGDYTGSSKGKVLNGVLKMWKVFRKMKILHLESSDDYSYGASNPLKASGAFLRNPYNFGPESNYVRTEGFVHSKMYVAGNRLRDSLANPAKYPDIIISGMFSGFLQADYDALYNFIERGGVVFLMIENPTSIVDNFMTKLFGTTVKSTYHDLGGAYYKLTSDDTEVLNYCFGDVRGKHWGQDASQTLYLTGVPEDAVYTYSYHSQNFPKFDGITMFRHKTKNLFFVGDCSILSNYYRNGTYPGYDLCPFATTTDGTDFPVPKKYCTYPRPESLDFGNFSGYGYAEVYNGTLFGNVFARLIATSQYMGVNRNP